MADERRRQLRSQRILQNAESRRQKILGITKKQNDPQEEIGASVPSFATSTPISPVNVEPESSNAFLKTPVTSRSEPKIAFRETNLQDNVNPTDMLSHEAALRNLLERNCFEDSTAQVKSSNIPLATPTDSKELKRSLMMPILLSILVCWCLSVGYGDVVFNSLSAPIILYELHYILTSLYLSRNEEASSFGSLEAVLTLCGINPKLINLYIKITNLLHSVFEDVALYFIVVVIWQYTIKISIDSTKEEHMETLH